MTDTIEHDVTSRLISTNPAYDVAVHLTYDPADPYAIHVDFLCEGETVAWILGRELLDQGMRSIAGEGHGDVRIWNAGPVVHVSLITPEGEALLEFSVAELFAFLTQTYMLVPSGTEMAAVIRELDTMDWGTL
jgi:hypothetical protein